MRPCALKLPGAPAPGVRLRLEKLLLSGPKLAETTSCSFLACPHTLCGSARPAWLVAVQLRKWKKLPGPRRRRGGEGAAGSGRKAALGARLPRVRGKFLSGRREACNIVVRREFSPGGRQRAGFCCSPGPVCPRAPVQKCSGISLGFK